MMLTGEAAKAVMQANQALGDVFERATGRELTRDEKRLLQRYERTIDENLPKCGAPAIRGLLPITKTE